MVKEPDDPRPTLGKRQFKTVADGFKDFEEYLVRTLGHTESDMAKREGMREDNYTAGHTIHRGVPSVLSATTPATPGYGMPVKQTTAGFDSDDSSDSDGDSDDDNDDGRRKGVRAGKSQAPQPAEGQGGASSLQVSQMEQFQQFLQWQKMQS